MPVTALSPSARTAALAEMTERELDVLVIGGGVVGAGSCVGRGDPGPVDGPGRGARLGQRDVVAIEQVDPRWPALPGDARLRVGQGGAARAFPDARPDRAAPRPAGAVPVPVDPQVLGAALRRLRNPAVRHHGQRHPSRRARAASPAPEQASGPSRGALSGSGVVHRRDPVLRRPGRRRAPRGDDRPHRGVLRCSGRQPDPRRRPAPRGGAGHRGRGRGPGDRREVQGAGQAGHQRDRRVDRRHPGHGRHPRDSSTSGRPRASTWSCRAIGCSPTPG